MTDDDALMTRNHAASVLSCDRRTIVAALATTMPDEPAGQGGPARWRRSTIIRALAAHEARTAH